MTLDLPAIRARAEAATPGPWYALPDPAPSRVDHGYRLVATTTRAAADNVYGLRDAMGYPGLTKLDSDSDADFIAHAREDVPALLAEVERLSRNLELASAECCDLSAYRQLVREEHPAEVAALTAEVERLRERVRRVALWVVDEVDPDMNEDDKQQLANEALEATRG